MSSVIKLSSPHTRDFWEIPVLYEDEHLLALDKPGNLPISPDRCDPSRPNLISLLHSGIELGKPWAKERSLTYLLNAHRLDMESSGVLLLAKSRPVLVRLADAFGSEQPNRLYVTLVQGAPGQDRFRVDAKLAPLPAQPDLVRVDSRNGKRAITTFETREKFDGWTLLQCAPLTGRRHQVRAHLRHARLPVVADTDYGGKRLLLSSIKPGYRLKPGHTERPLVGHLLLHAEHLSLAHPVTGEPLSISAPWPKELQVALKYLRSYAAVHTPTLSGHEHLGS